MHWCVMIFNSIVRFTKVGSDLPLYMTSALMKIGDTGIFKNHINIVVLKKHEKYLIYS